MYISIGVGTKCTDEFGKLENPFIVFENPFGKFENPFINGFCENCIIFNIGGNIGLGIFIFLSFILLFCKFFLRSSISFYVILLLVSDIFIFSLLLKILNKYSS